MNIQEFQSLVKEIVIKSRNLKDKHTDQQKAPVNYACIFCQSNQEYKEFQELANKLGKVIENTRSGPLFHIEPLKTISGKLKLLKIRNPDKTRPERGDADFTVTNYKEFKAKFLSQKGFSLIDKEDFEMIELVDPDFNIRTYFSHPPLDEQLGV